MIRRPQRSTLFPSTTPFRSAMVAAAAAGELGVLLLAGVDLVRDHGPRETAEAALSNAFVIAVDHEVNQTTRHADVLLPRSEEHTSELQSRQYLVCRLLLEKK